MHLYTYIYILFSKEKPIFSHISVHKNVYTTNTHKYTPHTHTRYTHTPTYTLKHTHTQTHGPIETQKHTQPLQNKLSYPFPISHALSHHIIKERDEYCFVVFQQKKKNPTANLSKCNVF